MYEDLIRNLRICQDGEHCDRCEFYGLKMANGLNACTEALCKQAADAIDELEFACNRYEKDYKAICAYLPKWIPVTERLPEDRHDVLVYAGVLFPYITVAYYDGLWKFSFNDEEIAGSADYWMPLPEPPKEET